MKRRELLTEDPVQTLVTDVTMRDPKLLHPLSCLSRLLVIFFSSFGINRLIANAFKTQCGIVAQLLPLFFWIAVLFLFFHSKKGLLGGLALTFIGFFGIWLKTDQNPVRYLGGGMALIWNRFMAIIDDMGYMSLPAIGEDLMLTEEALFFTLSMVSCLVFFLSLQKKTRLSPVLVYLILVCSPLFIYHMPDKNDGAAILAASLTGIMVMRLSEKHAEEKHHSGFVGATALLLACLLLLGPMVYVKEPWGDIPGISEQIEALRRIVTDLAEGKRPFLPSDDSTTGYNTPRSTVAAKRIFKGKHVLTVYSDAKTPLYLREWVGGEYRDNRWYAPDIYSVDPRYRPLTPESNPYYVTKYFLDAYERLQGGGKESTLGLLRETVTIVPSSIGSLLPLPVTTVSEIAPPNGSDLSPAYQTNSDFLYTVDRLSRKLPYQVETVLSYDYETEAYDEFVEAFFLYTLFTQNHLAPEPGTLAHKMVERFGQDGLKSAVSTSLARDKHAHALYRNVEQTDAIERIVKEIFKATDIEQYYQHYSYDDDLKGQPANGVITVTDADGKPQIYYLSSLGAVAHADEVAHLVADFLGERCSYTLSPADPTVDDAMEEFLFYGKEGYCVQFATAATLIMRRLGFTARYAEGYIAKEFSDNKKSDFPQDYLAQVKDHNAHAWMEVWVSGFGWKTVETTPGYTEDFYNQEGEPSRDPDTSDEITDPFPDTEDLISDTETDRDSDGTDDPRPPVTTSDSDTDDTPLDPQNPSDLTPWLSGLPAVVLLTVFILLVVRRGRRHRIAKESRIRLAMRGCPAVKRQTLATDLANDLNDALRAYRLSPKAGERPSAFGERADRALSAMGLDPSASRAVSALSRLVYGGLTEEEDLKAMAAVTDALMKQAKRRLGLFRFFYCRWIVCTI